MPPSSHWWRGSSGHHQLMHIEDGDIFSICERSGSGSLGMDSFQGPFKVHSLPFFTVPLACSPSCPVRHGFPAFVPIFQQSNLCCRWGCPVCSHCSVRNLGMCCASKEIKQTINFSNAFLDIIYVFQKIWQLCTCGFESAHMPLVVC